MSIVELTARRQATALAAGELSAREVVAAHLERIEAANSRINAVVTVRAERALAEAGAADERHAAGKGGLGALHGLPIAHKDTHETAGIRTTYGSPLHADHVPQRDELVIERMRAAGAICIGKTNVPEFAMGSHTFNPVFGATRNPHDHTKSAGGSSGGAAAALASGMQPLADGSDMGGSLRNPASFCNVVGLRPSPGRVPSWPATFGWHGLGVQGPMARTVEDCALLLSVLAGPDSRCPIALDEPGGTFAGPLERDLHGLRVAWAPDLGGKVPVEPEVAATLAGAVRTFTDLGCRVEHACPDLEGADTAFRTLRAWQLAHTFAAPFAESPERFKETLAWNIRVGQGLTGTEVATAEALRTELYHRAREFFTQYDLLLAPVSQVAPFDVGVEYPTEIDGVPMADYLAWMRSASLITALGVPAISVPAGFTGAGLPVGLQIIGPPRADFEALRAALAFEQALGLDPTPLRE